MGCGGSVSPSPAHSLLLKAYQDKNSINTVKLRVALKGLSASQLDARDHAFGWSALDLTALMDESSNCEKAASILIGAGADPFGGSEAFKETPLGKCVKYNNTKVLEQLLQTLDQAGWEKFIHMLAHPEVSKIASYVPEGSWVLVDGKKAKTRVTLGTDRHRISNTVTFEDGSSKTVGPERITVIPQASSKVLQVVYKIAKEKGCTKDQLERLQCVEESDRKINGAFRNEFRNDVVGLGLAVVMGGA